MSIVEDLQLATKVLKDAGYDATFVDTAPGPDAVRAAVAARAPIWRVVQVKAGRESVDIRAEAPERNRVARYLVSVRSNGDTKRRFEFTDYRDAISYFMRQAHAMRGGLSVKTRNYPHHGDGEKLPLPNPTGPKDQYALYDVWGQHQWQAETRPLVMRDILRMTGDGLAADIVISGSRACAGGKTHNKRCCAEIRARLKNPTSEEIRAAVTKLREAEGTRKNPSLGHRYTTRDAARILRTLKLHPRAYGPKELARGMNVEREHHAVTHGDEVMTAKIALAHLRERADYYEVLKRAEKAPRSNPTKREQQTILKIQRVLTPDLLKPRYRAGNKGNPMFGHCYAASDALYHLLGGKDAGYKPIVATDDTDGTHWWLLSPKGEILDVTAAQYTSVGKTPPYTAPDARGCGFSSHKDKRGQQQPGKEAREIIRRVQAKG